MQLVNRNKLSYRLGFFSVTYAFALVMLSTTIPTPLYPLYQESFDFSNLMVTVIFSFYSIGVLTVLLVFGRLSDQIGRRYVLIIGLVFSFVSSFVFLIANNLIALLLGRVLSGFSAGFFTGTATATLIDLTPEFKRRKASIIAAGANMIGLGLGTLISGMFSQYFILPIRLVFIVNIILVISALFLMWYIPEPVSINATFKWRLQKLRVPPKTRAVFIRSVIPGAAGFSVLGLYTSVVPGFLGDILYITNQALIGLVIFLLFAASFVGQLTFNSHSDYSVLSLGCVGLIAGMSLFGTALYLQSFILLILGTILSGLGQGLCFRSGLSLVYLNTFIENRAEVTSSYFFIVYLFISFPVIGVGLASLIFGLQLSGIAFSILIIILSTIALIILLIYKSKEVST